MGNKSSNKSTSYVSLNRQYRKLKRDWMNAATREDLVNMLVLVASDKKDLPQELQNVIKILAVCQITEQLVKLEKQTNAKVPTRTMPNRPTAIDGDTSTR